MSLAPSISALPPGSFICNTAQSEIQLHISLISPIGSFIFFLSKIISLRHFQIAQSKVEVPTRVSFLSSLGKLFIHLPKQSVRSTGIERRSRAHLIKFQISLATEQEKKRWSILSSLPQNTQVLSPFHPLFSKLSLVKILFLFNNHRKNLILAGTLIF